MSRAVVFGGGGPVGIAWESGLAVGLVKNGVALDDVDRVIGTSAGSVVGARLALGRDLAEELAQRGATAQPKDRRTPEGYESSVAPRMAQLREVMARAATWEGPREEALRMVGSFALSAEVPTEERFLAFFDNLANATEWPESFACTAVDAQTGEFVVWERASGVPLDRAVASSCSVPGIYPPITINGRRYMDGGMRSGLNADLAAGYDTVLVVAVTATPPESADLPVLVRMREQRNAELRALRESGAAVTLIEPDTAFSELTGGGLFLMDASRAPAAFDLGVTQGAREAARVAFGRT